MTDFNNDLLIMNNPADLILLATVYNYDGTNKSVTILIDSSQDWSTMTGEASNIMALGFFGMIILKAIEHDMNVAYYFLEYFQVINGISVDTGKARPFIRDGKRFKRMKVNRDGSYSLLPEDEF